MSDATTITALFNSITHGPAWHGPSTMEAVAGVTAEHAASHPVDGLHSIWVNAWQGYTLAVLRGEEPESLEDQDDWPLLPVPQGETEWHAACRDLERLGRELCEEVLHFDDARLKELVPNKDFSLKVLLHGVVAHNIYHGGQIALLRKCQDDDSDARSAVISA